MFFALNLKICRILRFTIRSYDLRSHLPSTILHRIPILTTLPPPLLMFPVSNHQPSISTTINCHPPTPVTTCRCWSLSSSVFHSIFNNTTKHLKIYIFFFKIFFIEPNTTCVQDPRGNNVVAS